MADEQRAPDATPIDRGPPTVSDVVGAFTKGKRSAANYAGEVLSDRGLRAKTMMTVGSAGFAGVMAYLLLRALTGYFDTSLALMREQHHEDVTQRSQQHDEDLRERRTDRCVAAQLNDTVRAAIWKERPRPREECK